MADMDSAVSVVTVAERHIITIAKPENDKFSRKFQILIILFHELLYAPIPACATTQESRRKSMTPQIFSKQRTSTPSIQPNLTLWLTASGIISVF